jgi:N utilization substance protein B
VTDSAVDNGTRRDAREWALQLLFALELNPQEEPVDYIGAFLADQKAEGQVASYARELVLGVLDKQQDLDTELIGHLRNWTLTRLGVVERCVLRLGVFELLFRRDVPGAVVINEAVDIAKNFGSEEAGGFVNGVLDKCYHTVRGGKG